MSIESIIQKKTDLIMYPICFSDQFKKKPLLKRNGLYNHCKVCIYHTLISTSTPEGSSNFIRASTVLEEEE